jgi:hypothetical protein
VCEHSCCKFSRQIQPAFAACIRDRMACASHDMLFTCTRKIVTNDMPVDERLSASTALKQTGPTPADNSRQKRHNYRDRRNKTILKFSIFFLIYDLTLTIPTHCNNYGQSKQHPPDIYFRGMNLEEFVEPIPGLPCLTGR